MSDAQLLLMLGAVFSVLTFVVKGPVGYFWQDDSTRNEAERVQLFSKTHETPDDLPIRWFLNEGATLPDDLERLRVMIEEYGFVLVVLDSVYNFTSGLDLKDRDDDINPNEDPKQANETNRKRLRSYGDVFKGAAARAGIYIDADGSKLYVEARGNTIAGFKRTPAYWDADALELRLVDTKAQEEADDELDGRVLEWLVEHAGRTRRRLSGRRSRVAQHGSMALSNAF